jgi:hypothetical protein
MVAVGNPDGKRRFRKEREFGLVVGGAVALLSAWWLYRGKFENVAYVTLPVGVLLVLFGLLVPRALIWPNRAWMRLAEGLSFVTTRVILAFVYFAIVTPIGFVKRLFGWDPLHRRAGSNDSYWRPYTERQRNRRHYEKMF